MKFKKNYLVKTNKVRWFANIKYRVGSRSPFHSVVIPSLHSTFRHTLDRDHRLETLEVKSFGILKQDECRGA